MTKIPGLALIGAAAAAAVQPLTPGGWWLDSGRGVAIVAAALAVVAAAIASRWMTWTWPLRRGDAAAALALWAGANIGMAAVLFRVGPGNIFPIVLAIGAALSAVAVAGGLAIGMLLAVASRRASG